MNKPIATLILALSGVLFSGCQGNPWRDFYQTYQELPAEAPFNGPPSCVPVPEFDASVLEQLRNGFVVIGYTSFNAGANISLADLQSFGESIKADLILYAIGNATQTQSAMVVPHFNPGRQQTTFINGYGSNGSSFYGTANSYSSGTYSTSVVPVTVYRQDYGAVFLKKAWISPLLGVVPRPLTPEESMRAGTNNALYVLTVIRGTPAFRADIFEGDIVLEAGGTTPHEFWTSIESWSGKSVKFVILRQGQRVVKQVTLNSR